MKTLIFPILSLAVVFGCDLGDTGADPTFGTDYTLLQKNQYPLLTNDSVHILVGYGGCSGNHPFVFQYQIHGSKAELWLYKDGRAEECMAYFQEIKSIPLPQEVAASQSVTLLGPQGKKIPLR